MLAFRFRLEVDTGQFDAAQCFAVVQVVLDLS
jgi:hypothetical protein